MKVGAGTHLILREETVKSYSKWAIRELMMNAVMHRDYESSTPLRFYEFNNPERAKKYLNL